jgi:hypothetical protein
MCVLSSSVGRYEKEKRVHVLYMASRGKRRTIDEVFPAANVAFGAQVGVHNFPE